MENSISKMTYCEAKEYVEDNTSCVWGENDSEVVRECSHCGAWVKVEEQSGEAEINGHTYYDICDDCKERIVMGIPLDTKDYNDCEDEDIDYYEEELEWENEFTEEEEEC